MDDVKWWDTCDDPGEMLDVLNERGADRRLFRLLCLACCRRVELLLPTETFRDAISLVEAWAEGRLPEEERQEAWEGVNAALSALPGFDDFNRHRVENASYRAALAVDFSLWTDVRRNHGNAEGTGYVLSHTSQAMALSKGADWKTNLERWQSAVAMEAAVQAKLIRQLFGNPFRSVSSA